MTDIEVLFPAESIAGRVEEIAGQIAAAGYQDLLVVVVLKGSFIFAADLVRALHRHGVDPQVEFMMLSSYGEALQSSGNVKIVKDVDSAVNGRDVLIVDDILESGRTLAFARTVLKARGAERVGIAVLLDKPGRRAADITADFIGFDCPDLFVVGYGMDARHQFRQLPFVGFVKG